MNLQDLKNEIQKYQYLEDTNIIDMSVASIIATRLKLGEPLWFIIIGASSGGKSQIIRPLSMTDRKFIHRLDDMTENTLLSAMKKKGDGEVSLLKKIGDHGMLAISDMTVLMSKSSESKSAILSQFRMVYDGEMIKHAGNSPEPLRWQGYVGVISGSTPSVYSMFEEASEMGERFVYYRMKEFDGNKSTRLALTRSKIGRELDQELADKYAEYIKDVVVNAPTEHFDIPEYIIERIIEVSSFAERVRTVAHTDKFTSDKKITRIPIPAKPTRVAMQLATVVKALMLMKLHDTGSMELDENDLSTIDWCGYSLANEEKRKCLSILASVEFDRELSTSAIADRVGLDTTIVRNFLQNLSAVGVLDRSGSDEGRGLSWAFVNKEDYDLVRRIEKKKDFDEIKNRGASSEEDDELDEIAEKEFGEL